MSRLSLKKINPTILISFLLVSMFLGFLPQAQALQIKDYPSFLNIRAGMTLTELVSGIFNFLLMIAGLAAFIMIIWGGIKYLTSAGDPSKMGDAKGQIFAAILGLIIMFSSWMILNTINPQLVELKEPGATTVTPTTPVAPPVLAGACVGSPDYVGLLYPQINYQPETNPAKCYKSSESVASFNGNIRSIKINGSSVAVKLFDESNFQGKSICFVSSQNNLGNCYVDCPPGIFSWFCTAAWPGAIKSLKIISAGECSSPGQTIGADGISKDGNEICK